MISFGEKMKQYRKLKNLTQAELARELKMQRQIISVYEKNERSPKIETALEIADVLGFSLDELYPEDKKKNSLSIEERKLILAYRSNPYMQRAVNKLLDLDDCDEKQDQIHVYMAARSEDNCPPEITDLPSNIEDVLENAKESEEDL